jgi:hypothetical protein
VRKEQKMLDFESARLGLLAVSGRFSGQPEMRHERYM